MTQRPALRLIATGGTFDKHYDPLAGALGFHESHLADMLTQFRVSAEVALEVPMLIDSLEMQDQHRATLVDCCARSPENAIVIVHGTDTMTITADVLAADARLRHCCIVLTGAMIPYEVNQTDASFNLGYALAAAQLLPAGVWIAMNACVHPAGAVSKNRALGRFVAP